MNEQIKGYLDFHSHIIPGVDDGARDWDMTRDMLQSAYEQGVLTMVATSHYYPGETKVSPEEYRKLVAQADAIAKEIHSSMQVLAGNEILYQDGVAEHIRQGEVLTMADSQYVLIEFIPSARRSTVEQGIREVIEAGYAPVIAHVERVEAIFSDDSFAQRLHQMGCYMQTNTRSLLGGLFDKRSKRLKQWIEAGYIQFLGSDCHNTGERAPLMGDAVRKLEKSLGSRTLQRLLFDYQALFLAKKYI